jgi:hypothetical protein
MENPENTMKNIGRVDLSPGNRMDKENLSQNTI